MLRLFLSFLCSIAFSLQILLIAGCAGSNSMAAKSSGSGSSSGSSSGTGSASGGSGSTSGSGSSSGSSSTSGSGGTGGSGYDNGNGQITGVWMQSPTPGANPSHVQVNATAYGPATVTKWIIYLDDQSAYESDNPSSSVAHAIDIPTGQHLLYTRAWDAAGDSNRSEVALIQVGPAAPSSTVLPTPPANAQVLSQMQNDSTWSICSVCAAGTNSTGNYLMTPAQSQPSLSGSSMEMYVDGPQWTNVLFMNKILGTNSSTHFLWDFQVYHDPAAEDHFWASEFDFWQILGGKEFMIGSQCDFGDGHWSTWDSQGDRWVLNGIACPHWTPGWHHIQWYVERISDTQYRYDTLVVDGTPYGLNQTWNVNTTDWPDMIGIQYQLDQDTSGTPLHEWVDNVTLTMW